MKREQISALQHLFYGHASVPVRKDFENAWKAVRTIAAGGGRLTSSRREWLLARMTAIGTPADVVSDVMAWDERGEPLAALFSRVAVPAEVRWSTGAWIVYEGLSVAMADGELTRSEVEAVRAAVAALDVEPGTVDALVEICREEAEIRRRRIGVLFSKRASGYRYDML